MLARQQVLGGGRARPFARQRPIAQPALVRAEVHPRQAQSPVQAEGGLHDVGVGLVGGAHDELGRVLDAGAPAATGRQAADEPHRPHDVAVVILLRRQRPEGPARRHLDVQRHGVGNVHGLLDGGVRRPGNDLQVQVPAIRVPAAEDLCHGQHAVHRGVGVANNARRQEQAEHPPGPHVIHERGGHFLRGESAPGGVAVAPQGAIPAVVRAGVRQKRLEHDLGAAARHRRRVQPQAARAALPVVGRPLRAARARQVVPRRVGQEPEPFERVHVLKGLRPLRRPPRPRAPPACPAPGDARPDTTLTYSERQAKSCRVRKTEAPGSSAKPQTLGWHAHAAAGVGMSHVGHGACPGNDGLGMPPMPESLGAPARHRAGSAGPRKTDPPNVVRMTWSGAAGSKCTRWMWANGSARNGCHVAPSSLLRYRPDSRAPSVSVV